nr:MAG TPA: hypothetical protein [Bacteriophage sp.]
MKQNSILTEPKSHHTFNITTLRLYNLIKILIKL